jgi:hypothetical protein
METADLEAVVQEYLKAFEARNLEQCMSFYGDGSTLEFVTVFSGLPQIEEWHKARFAAGLRVVRVDRITVDGSKVAVDAVATSKRLRAWRVNSISGTITALFDGGKIKEMKFGLRMG